MAHLYFAVNDPASIKPVADHFRKEGHRVVVETDGRVMERQLQEEPPDVLVTANVLPYTDGFQLKKLLDTHHPGRTQCLLLTTLANDGIPFMGHGSSHFEGYCLSRDFWQRVLCIQQLLLFRLTLRDLEPTP